MPSLQLELRMYSSGPKIKVYGALGPGAQDSNFDVSRHMLCQGPSGCHTVDTYTPERAEPARKP